MMFWLTDYVLVDIYKQAKIDACGTQTDPVWLFVWRANKESILNFYKWQTDICDGFCGRYRHDKCEIIEDGEIKTSPYRIPRMDCYKCQKIVRKELGL